MAAVRPHRALDADKQAWESALRAKLMPFSLGTPS